MPRFFSLPEAEGLLPEIELSLRHLMQHKRQYDDADSELSRISRRIAASGGMIPPRDEIRVLRARKDASARGLQAAFERIQQTGCQLKDIEMGLIDFPTLYRGKEVYLCWKLGEAGIEYWHPVEDGYRGRRPIDGDFLANHRGDEE